MQINSATALFIDLASSEFGSNFSRRLKRQIWWTDTLLQFFVTFLLLTYNLLHMISKT